MLKKASLWRHISRSVFTGVSDVENALNRNALGGKKCDVSRMSPSFPFFLYFMCVIKGGPKYVLPLFCSLWSVGDSESSEKHSRCHFLWLFFFLAVVLLLMTYSFASLHSACLENNEHVCCINLCNGKQEEGWVWGGSEGGGGREEWWAHAAALQLL